MESPHQIYGIIIMTSNGAPVWYGWHNTALGVPVAKLAQAVAGYFKSQGGNQNSCYLDASSFAAASTSDGDCIVTLVCSLASPETEVLLKAREVSHAVKLLYGSDIGGVLTAANLSPSESPETTDLLQLLQATPSSNSLPASLRDWLHHTAKHEDVAGFILGKLQTLSPCSMAFSMLEEAPGFICSHFIDVTEPGEVLLSHWPKSSDGGASDTSGKSSSGGGGPMSKIKQMGKGVMSALSRSQGGAAPAGRGSHRSVSASVIASMQQLMARHVSSLWTVIMREAKGLAKLQSKQQANQQEGTSASNICTIDLSALVSDAAATIRLVSLQHYEAAFVVVYRHDSAGQSERPSRNSGKGGGAFHVTYGHSATSAGVVPFLEQACQDLKARFPITRHQLLRQVWPDMPGSTAGAPTTRPAALPSRPSLNRSSAAVHPETAASDAGSNSGAAGTSTAPEAQRAAKAAVAPPPPPSAAMKSVSSALGMRVMGIMQQNKPLPGPAQPGSAEGDASRGTDSSSTHKPEHGGASAAGGSRAKPAQTLPAFNSPWRIGTAASEPDWLIQEHDSDANDSDLQLPDLSAAPDKGGAPAGKPTSSAKTRYKPMVLGAHGNNTDVSSAVSGSPSNQKSPVPAVLASQGRSPDSGRNLAHLSASVRSRKSRDGRHHGAGHVSSPDNKENTPQTGAAQSAPGQPLRTGLFPAQPPSVPKDKSYQASRPVGLVQAPSGVIGVLGSQQPALQPGGANLMPQPPQPQPTVRGFSPNVRRRSGHQTAGQPPLMYTSGPQPHEYHPQQPHLHHLHHHNHGYGSEDEWEQYKQYKSGHWHGRLSHRHSSKTFRSFLDSPVRVASAWELLQASLSREEERQWRLHLMYENISLRHALEAGSLPPRHPHLLPSPAYSVPAAATSCFSIPRQPYPPSQCTAPELAHSYAHQPAPYTTIQIHAGSPAVATTSPSPAGSPQPSMSSPPPVQVLVSPPGPPSTAPYNIWQLFNGSWYRLTPAGLWVASSDPPTSPSAHVIPNPSSTLPSSPTQHTRSHPVPAASHGVPPPGLPVSTQYTCVDLQPPRLAYDVATDLWQRVQHQVESQVYAALISLLSPQGMSLPAATTGQVSAGLTAHGRKQAAWSTDVSQQEHSASGLPGVEFYKGLKGEVYCKVADKWYEVHEGTAPV